jgi:hypothetical protein
MRNLTRILKEDQWAQQSDIRIYVTSDIFGMVNWRFGEIT